MIDEKEAAKRELATKKVREALSGVSAPQHVRVTRGDMVWQMYAPWPGRSFGPKEDGPNPFYVGTIFEYDPDTYIVFGVPRKGANGEALKSVPTALGDFCDPKRVIIAFVPKDPTEPLVESVVSHDDASVMVANYRLDNRDFGDWPEDDEDEKPEPAA